MTIRPTAEHAFLYYLRAFNSSISVMIQTLGGNTLLAAYQLAIRAENNLIQAGQIAPRPPMPIFPMALVTQPTIPLQEVPLAMIHQHQHY